MNGLSNLSFINILYFREIKTFFIFKTKLKLNSNLKINKFSCFLLHVLLRERKKNKIFNN